MKFDSNRRKENHKYNYNRHGASRVICCSLSFPHLFPLHLTLAIAWRLQHSCLLSSISRALARRGRGHCFGIECARRGWVRKIGTGLTYLILHFVSSSSVIFVSSSSIFSHLARFPQRERRALSWDFINRPSKPGCGKG